MASLDIQFPRRVLFGIDSLNRAGELARSFGPRALILTEAAIHDNPHLSQLRNVLSRSGVQVLVFDEMDATSGNETFHSLAGMARASKPSSIIALGGGKALSTARMLSALHDGKTSLERHMAGEMPAGPSLPLICIPSTCRDHYLFRNDYVVNDQYARKPVVLASPDCQSRHVIMDPRISISLSHKYFSVAVMDILLASAEAYLSSDACFLSDTHALDSIRRIAENHADLAHNPRDIRPRVAIAEASLLSALATGTSGQGPGGAIACAANARFGVPRSWVATALLPHVLDLHAGPQPERVAAIARALGEDTDNVSAEDAAMRASRSVRRIIARLDIPGRLRDFNLSVDMVPELAELALELPFSRKIPFTISHQSVYDLLKQAF